MTDIERTHLTLAAGVLDQAGALCAQGWTQGVFARDENGKGCGATAAAAGCWCLSGAYTKAMHIVVGTAASWQRWDAVWALCDAALVSAILATCPTGADREDTDDRIASWNDAPERTQGEVVAVCCHAAGELRAAA